MSNKDKTSNVFIIYKKSKVYYLRIQIKVLFFVYIHIHVMRFRLHCATIVAIAIDTISIAVNVTRLDELGASGMAGSVWCNRLQPAPSHSQQCSRVSHRPSLDEMQPRTIVSSDGKILIVIKNI